MKKNETSLGTVYGMVLRGSQGRGPDRPQATDYRHSVGGRRRKIIGGRVSSAVSADVRSVAITRAAVREVHRRRGWAVRRFGGPIGDTRTRTLRFTTADQQRTGRSKGDRGGLRRRTTTVGGIVRMRAGIHDAYDSSKGNVRILYTQESTSGDGWRGIKGGERQSTFALQADVASRCLSIYFRRIWQISPPNAGVMDDISVDCSGKHPT